ncbi:MAG: ASKHA domain-containing protein, partial [Candidatus Baldrarchaeia archaeon]
MPRKVQIVFEPDGLKSNVNPGVTILEAAKICGIKIRSECGGHGFCGKCKVIAKTPEGLTSLSEREKELLSDQEIKKGYRLACQAYIKGNTVIYVPEESRITKRKTLIEGVMQEVEISPLVEKFYIIIPKPSLQDLRTDFDRMIESLKDIYNLESLEIPLELLKTLPLKLRDANWKVTATIWNRKRIISVEPGNTTQKLYGIAIDIGTSKIIGYLVDLLSGKVVATRFIENPQIIYGEDIISRISHVMKNPQTLEEIHSLAIKAINEIILKCCEKAGIEQTDIYEAVVVGNTAMHHFFLNINPKYLALSPYVPAIGNSVNVEARELKINICPHGNVHVLPVIAGFVGADAVGDILATKIFEAEKICLTIDIGTNTEIVLGNKDELFTTSCASGPAFEGMHITHGMKAVEGAIEKVRIDPETFEVHYETIGNTEPVGICGSAMVDIVAEMLKTGLIDRTGKFKVNKSAKRFQKVNNEYVFVIAKPNETRSGTPIIVTQKDIREIQLAKAAIHTGCSILMRKRGVSTGLIDKIFVAGAFGNYLNIENSIIIGLLPDVPSSKVKFVGNAAGSGAIMSLISKKEREKAKEIAKRTKYIELAIDPSFHMELAASMYLPHKNLDKFPTVKKLLEKRGL